MYTYVSSHDLHSSQSRLRLRIFSLVQSSQLILDISERLRLPYCQPKGASFHLEHSSSFDDNYFFGRLMAFHSERHRRNV